MLIMTEKKLLATSRNLRYYHSTAKLKYLVGEFKLEAENHLIASGLFIVWGAIK